MEGTSDFEKAGYLHSVSLDRCYYFVKNHARLHNYGGKKCCCPKCNLIPIFEPMLTIRRHMDILNVLDNRNRKNPRANFAAFT